MSRSSGCKKKTERPSARPCFPGVYDRTSRRLRLVTATNVVHFLREAHWPATMHDRGRHQPGVGRTSYVAATALFVGEACIGLCDTVLVMLDDDGPTPIPDDARAHLATLRLRAD